MHRIHWRKKDVWAFYTIPVGRQISCCKALSRGRTQVVPACEQTRRRGSFGSWVNASQPRLQKVARIYKFPILACLQRDVLSLDRDISIYDYLDAITVPLAQGEAYIGLVNLSTANTMSDWILVCILDKHICVYSVPLGTILTLERVNGQVSPIRGVQGFAWLDGAAIYIHGQHSSQLVTLMQTHKAIDGT